MKAAMISRSEGVERAAGGRETRGFGQPYVTDERANTRYIRVKNIGDNIA